MCFDPTNFKMRYLTSELNFEPCFVLRVLRRRRDRGESAKLLIVHMVYLSNVTVKCIGEPILLEQYVVLKNYQKQYHNDISLTKGYTVGVIEKHESGKYTTEVVRHSRRSSRDIVY